MNVNLRKRLLQGGWAVGGESGCVLPSGVAVGAVDFWQRDTPNGGLLAYSVPDGPGEPDSLNSPARIAFYSRGDDLWDGRKPDAEISGSAGLVLEIADSFVRGLNRG